MLVLLGTLLLGSSYAHASAVTISDAATYAQLPDVAVDTNGVSASVFVQGSQIFANVKSASGAWLASPVAVSSAGSGLADSNVPKVRALNGGGFVVAWVQRNTNGEWGVFACKLNAATAVCSTPVAVFGTPTGGNYYSQNDMALAVDDTSGKVFVVDYKGGTSGWMAMTAATSTDGGATWSTAVTMSDPGSIGSPPPPRPLGFGGLGAAATSGKLVTVGADANNQNGISSWIFDPASVGTEWSNSALSGTINTNDPLPISVSASGGKALAIWKSNQQGGNGLYTITYGYSANAGTTWAGANINAGMDAQVGPVALVTAQGRMLLTWNTSGSFSGVDRAIQTTLSDDSGTSWSNVEDLLTYPSNAGFLINRGLYAAGNSAGDATVAWAFANFNNKIAARSLPHGPTPIWDAESVLYPSTAIVDYNGGLAGGGSGVFTLIWTQPTSYIKSLGFTYPAAPADATAPTTSAVSASATGQTTSDLLGTSDEAATGYWVVLPGPSAAAPTAVQVKAGQDSAGSAVPSGKSGSAAMTAATPKTFAITGLTASTAYTICLMAEDASGNKSSVTCSEITTQAVPDVTPPTTSAVSASATGQTTADLLGTSDEAATGYWVVLPGPSATAPTAVQVKAGQNSAGSAVPSGKSGSAVMTAATPKTFAITGLTASTAYTICLMAEDASGNKSSVTCSDITTQAVPDVTPPTTSAVSASATGQTTADLLGTSDEAATGYWVVLPGPSATAPTAVQVKAGQNSAGSAVPSGKSGSAAMTAATPKTFAITGLTASTAYTICLMAEDASGNKSSVTCSEITTQAVPDVTPPTTSAVSASATGQTTANLLGTSDEAATGYWVVLPGPSAAAPTAVQVKAGQDSASSAVPGGKSGNAVMTAATPKTFAITGLTASTAYTICLMAEDASGNKSSVTCSDITTQAIPAPTVGSINPTSGSTAGGTSVTITGTNLTGASAVTIGGNACTSVTVVSATSITCTTPAGSAGAASVLVTTAGGTSASGTSFTYSVNANGACGSAQGQAASIAPSLNLCTTGTAGSVAAALGGYSWSCAGLGSGAPASCTAPGATASGSTTSTTLELVSGTGCSFSRAAPVVPPAGGPGGGVSLPYGVMDFELLGCTGGQATVRMTYSGPVGNMALWKYGPYPTPASPVSWYQLTTATVSGNTITFTIQDNGVGDADPATGVIADPAGPGNAPGSAQSIPTLSEWATILMAGLLGLFGLAQVRRRR